MRIKLIRGPLLATGVYLVALVVATPGIQLWQLVCAGLSLGLYIFLAE